MKIYVNANIMKTQIKPRAIVLGRGLPLGQLLLLVPGGLRPLLWSPLHLKNNFFFKFSLNLISSKINKNANVIKMQIFHKKMYDFLDYF